MKWNKLPKKNEGQRQPHPYIKNSDDCYYAREYNTGDKNFKSNQLIYNFKRPPQFAPKERSKAIKQISEEITELLKPNGIYTITALPSSKIKTDPEYLLRLKITKKSFL